MCPSWIIGRGKSESEEESSGVEGVLEVEACRRGIAGRSVREVDARAAVRSEVEAIL